MLNAAVIAPTKKKIMSGFFGDYDILLCFSFQLHTLHQTILPFIHLLFLFKSMIDGFM